MTATMTRTEELAALQSDAEQRVLDLEEQRARLAPEALVDGSVKDELATVEGEIAEARKAREVATLAQEELVRRERQAEADAQQAEVNRALDRARSLQDERAKAARAADVAARKYAEALAGYRDVCDSQAHQLSAAGRGEGDLRRCSFSTALAAGALRHALLEADAPHIEGLDMYGRKDRPLADTDPKVGV